MIHPPDIPDHCHNAPNLGEKDTGEDIYIPAGLKSSSLKCPEHTLMLGVNFFPVLMAISHRFLSLGSFGDRVQADLSTNRSGTTLWYCTYHITVKSWHDLSSFTIKKKN